MGDEAGSQTLTLWTASHSISQPGQEEPEQPIEKLLSQAEAWATDRDVTS
jgi:hypothetical protein